MGYAPFPVFANLCHMSREYLYSLDHLILMAAFLSSDIAVLQLFFVTCSTACPISFSLLLKVTGFTGGIFNVHSKLFRWVSPIPVCRHPRTALELTSWVSGPLWPLLCSLEVFTTFSAPHTALVTENTEANPHFFLQLCSTTTNWLKIKWIYWYSGKSNTFFWQRVLSFNLE